MLPKYAVCHKEGLASLQSFMASGRAQADFQPMPLPQLRLTVEDQCRLRDRSTIMARQMYASQGSQYADAQVHVIYVICY